MKIKVTETCIEASSEDLKHSNSLAQSFSMVFNRIFARMAYPDNVSGTEEEDEEEDDNDIS